MSPRTQKILCDLEDRALAPYAVHADALEGRRYPETPHPYRTEFQRDRDRIIHCKSFRRLKYKTQVLLLPEGDHYRTRLTHTLEVSQIARTISRALRLNEDLTEAIALAHDLGHTPFGHAGERTLHSLMEGYGGFDHNLQAIRVVDLLETKYPAYDGLNLTWEVRSGLVKHRSQLHPVMLDGRALDPAPILEAQVADLADDLTYYGHDVDDGLDSGIITEDMLNDIAIWRLAAEETKSLGLKRGDDKFVTYTVRALINRMVGDAIETSAKLIEAAGVKSPGDAPAKGMTLIAWSQEFQMLTSELKSFLYENLYFSQELKKLNQLSRERMSFLFETFVKHPELAGSQVRRRMESDGIHRAVTDYIAGMTDVFAICEYHRLK